MTKYPKAPDFIGLAACLFLLTSLVLLTGSRIGITISNALRILFSPGDSILFAERRSLPLPALTQWQILLITGVCDSFLLHSFHTAYLTPSNPLINLTF